MKRTEALRLRTIIEQAVEGLADKEAASSVTLQSAAPDSADWWDGHLVKGGTRLRWHNGLVRARADLWAWTEYNPDNAPELWEAIQYREGHRVLTGPITATNPVQPGECCWEGEVLYRNISGAATTYRPSEYARAWEAVEQ